MEIQALSPETIQDTQSTSSDSISPDHIDSTFGTTCIGRAPSSPSQKLSPLLRFVVQSPALYQLVLKQFTNEQPTDLVSAPLTSRILSFSDEFFASASNLINPAKPIHRPGYFVETGAWYDGWETRRHNRSPPDWVVIRLGPAAGIVKGVEVDTAFFNGNHAESVEVWGTYETGQGADGRVKESGYKGWRSLLGKRGCGASRRQAWKIDGEIQKVTHVKLCMFPDGGIARFRLYGVAVPVWPEDESEDVELSSALMGGRVVAFSDEHFGKAGNVLMPGRGVDMGDGWETKRSRESGHADWLVVKLGARGSVRSCMVDTMHFRGNFPQRVQVEGLDAEEGEEVVGGDDERWAEIVGPQGCEKDKEHVFAGGLLKSVEGRTFTHMKMTIIPDGGVKRFRVFGTRA